MRRSARRPSQDVVPGSVPRVANVAGTTMRIQTDKLTDDETLQIKDGLTKAYGVTDNEVTSTFVGPTWGADVTKQALMGLRDLRGPGRRPDGAVLPDLEDVALGPRRAWLVTMFITAGVYAPQRLRGHAVGDHRLPHGAQLLAVRHRGGVRQDPGEHGGHAGIHPADLRRGGQPRRQPDPGPLHQHHDGGHPARSARSSSSGPGCWVPERCGTCPWRCSWASWSAPPRRSSSPLRCTPGCARANLTWSSRPSAWSSAVRTRPPRRRAAEAASLAAA